MTSFEMREHEAVAGGIAVRLTNTGKVLFPGDGITKGELIEHYGNLAGRMLPYLRDRPIAMARYPDGIDHQRIFQKNPADYFPGWITSVEVGKQDGTLRHVVCDKAATLVYLANQACVELHAFLSRADSLNCPDQIVVDFDPPDDAGFGDARRCSLWLRDLLAGELGLTCYVKTTGGKGLHVHVLLNRHADFDAAREFARDAATVLAARHPDVVTVEQRKEARGGRVYADVMRNGYAQTAVAPYSVRARPGAPVATPLHWEEVEDPGLTAHRFTLRTISARLDETADPWAGMTRHRYDLAAARRRLDGLLPSGSR
ncbi:MAG TPA: non-homologous end-joining DNA ligase [Streptosporangiaceae bacterium]|nr:non-homologous end-joining DNA ligase [Streptosporangiaceae bacterium]